MTGVLITGATGNLGSRLVKEYVQATDDVLYLLVRGSSDREAWARTAEALGYWDLDLEALSHRVHVLRGDVQQPGLGLTETCLSELVDRVNVVVHAASPLNLDMSLAEARRAIVQGTRHVLGIAESLKDLHMLGFASTLELVGAYGGVLHEEYLTDYSIPFLNNYEAAKYEAEELLQERGARGLPVTVFRLSMLVGECTTGRIPKFQSFYLLLEKAVVAPDYPIVPKDPPLDVIPIDFAATMIRRIVSDSSSTGRVFHLCEGEPHRVDFERFREAVRPTIGIALGRLPRRAPQVPARAFRGRLDTAARFCTGPRRRALEVQSMFLRFFGIPGRLVNPEARRLARRHGLPWPRLEDYAPVLVGHYLTRRAHVRFPF